MCLFLAHDHDMLMIAKGQAFQECGAQKNAWWGNCDQNPTYSSRNLWNGHEREHVTMLLRDAVDGTD